MEIVQRPIASIRPYDKNPRRNDQAVAAVAKSIQEFGFRQPIIVDADGVIIVGHTRYKAALKLGMTHVPVGVATDLTPAQAKAYRIADNRTAEIATWDTDLLSAELADLAASAFDMSPFMLTQNDDTAKEPPRNMELQYAVLIHVADEQEQKQLLQQADREGLKTSAVIMGISEKKPNHTTPPPALPNATTIVRTTPIERSVRVRQVEGMFDLPETTTLERRWDYVMDLPREWSIGAIVGPSGSGKSTLAREWFGDRIVDGWPWPPTKSILDGFPEAMSIHDVVGLLSSVGFSSPPDWTKPYHVLSTGEKFRVDVARTLAESPDLAVIDEYTSVVDRTVAQIGSAAVAKAVRASGRRLVVVSCHYDILDWLCPDWVIDTATGALTRRSLRRPPIKLVVRRTGKDSWKTFAHYHYLSHDLAPTAKCFIGTIDDRPAAFVAVISQPHARRSGWRISRVVCLPDFQGVGVGAAMLDQVAAAYKATGKYVSIVTRHPAMIASLVRSRNWACREWFAIHDAAPLWGGGGRVSCSFRFVGAADHEAATALDITVPNAMRAGDSVPAS